MKTKAATHHKKRAKRAPSTQLQDEFGFGRPPASPEISAIVAEAVAMFDGRLVLDAAAKGAHDIL
jgi:hypothetical protein